MEFLFGALSTLLAVYFGSRYLGKKDRYKLSLPTIAQSTKFEALKAVYTYEQSLLIPLETQSTKFYNANSVKVLFTEDKAYWIHQNTFYVADLTPEEGLVIEESTREVDTMGLNDVELEEMFFIVEKLTEGKRNDNWG